MRVAPEPADRGVWDRRVKVESNAYNWAQEPKLIESKVTSSGPFVVDLFAGAGGFSVGFGAAGITPILAVDIHKPSIDTYLHNHAQAGAVLGDIRRVPTGAIEEILRGAHVSLVSAGVPCQGFSLCNRKRWEEDERNFLFLEFARIVRALRPEYVLLENVSGLVSTANGSFVRDISNAISELGYKVESQMLNAVNYGVPQRRQRVFFLGALPGFPVSWPAPTTGAGRAAVLTVSDAISDLPLVECGQVKTEYEVAPKCAFQKLMRRDATKLLNHEAPNHPKATIRRIGDTKPGQPMYSAFRQRIRLHPAQPSPTQVSGGIRPQFSLGHPTQARGLTIRERCRIQSFPDNYLITGGIVQGRVQTGNAVSPLLAQALGDVILAGIQGKPPPREVLPNSASQMVLSFS